MALITKKTSGLGQRFYIEGFDVSGDVSAIDLASGKRNTMDVTDITQSAIARAALLADGELSFSLWFDKGAGQEHVALSALPRTALGVLWLLSVTAGDPAAYLQSKEVDYNWTRAPDGSLKGKVQCLGDGSPLEWGIILAPKKQHASATAEIGINDVTGDTVSGAVGYLEHFSCATGTVVYIIEHSSDSTTGSDGTWTTLLTLATVATPYTPISARVVVSGTVHKWLRVSTTGTFTNANFAAAFRRKSTASDQ